MGHYFLDIQYLNNLLDIQTILYNIYNIFESAQTKKKYFYNYGFMYLANEKTVFSQQDPMLNKIKWNGSRQIRTL